MRRLLLRAPLAALGSPITMLVAVLAGMAVAFVAAGTVFHVSASGSAATQYVVGTRCPDAIGLVVTPDYQHVFGDHIPFGQVHATLPGIAENARRHGLEQVRRTRLLEPTLYTARSTGVRAQFMDRDGGLERVRPISGGGDGGAWVPADLARIHDLTVGGALTVGDGPDARQLPIAAIYPDFTDPLDPVWCSARKDVVPNPLSDTAPPPTILLPPAVMDELVGDGPVELQLEITRPQAPRTADEAASYQLALDALEADIDRELFRTDRSATLVATVGPRAHRAVTESLLPLSGVSLLVALGAVSGLARQWVQRRFAELRLLWARGVAPSTLGVKAVLELAAPLLTGAALGWAAAWLVVPMVGPAAHLDPWAPWLAVLAAAVGWVLGLAVVGSAATVRVRRQLQPRGRGGRLRWVRWLPWELAALAGAVLCYQRLRRGGTTVDPRTLLPVVDAIALMYPLLCLAVVVGVAGRLFVLLLRGGHRLRRWRYPAVLWAARRSAAQQRLAVALVVVAGLSVGVVAVGIGVSGTEKGAVLDKGRVFVGTDTVVRLRETMGDTDELPAAIAGNSTLVVARETGLAGSRTGRLLVVDPETFPRGVVWRDEWTGARLADLMAALGPVGADGRLPAIQVGTFAPDAFDRGALPPMTAVATVATFPGRHHTDGMLVVSRDALPDLDRSGFSRFVWTRGDAATTVGALTAAGEPTGGLLTAVEATNGLPFLIVAWTFDFFVLMGAVLAVVAVAALLVAIEARRRATAVAYALLARMGLRARSAYASQLVELAAIAVVACVTGLLGGVLVLATAAGHLDPAPLLTPSPVPVSLLPLAALVTVVAAVAVALTAALATRAAVRAPVRDLLRSGAA